MAAEAAAARIILGLLDRGNKGTGTLFHGGNNVPVPLFLPLFSAISILEIGTSSANSP